MSLKWRIKTVTPNPDHTQHLEVEFLAGAGAPFAPRITITVTVTKNASPEDIRWRLREAVRDQVTADRLINAVFDL